MNYVIELNGLLTVFSKLDCVYGVQSNMLMLCLKNKKHTFSHKLLFIQHHFVPDPINANNFLFL